MRAGILAYGMERPTTGIGRYATELITALSAYRPDIELVLLKPAGTSIPAMNHLETIPLRGARLLPGMMTAGAVQLPLLARRFGLDVIHDPSGIAPFLPLTKSDDVRIIVTIHDMIPYILPDTHPVATKFLFRHYLPRTIKQADVVLTVSDCSKSDIEARFEVAQGRVRRIYCGVDHRFSPQPPELIQSVKQKLGIDGPYFLAVGSLEPRKNLGTAVQAFTQFRSSTNAQCKLVIVGKKAWKTNSVLSSIGKDPESNEILLTGYVDDSDLPALYSGALALLFPSLYEGFGLPPLEAMACGTPVIASNSSAIPEVVGDAAVLVSPTDRDAFTAAMINFHHDEESIRSWSAKGIARARLFSWEQAAKEHAMVYERQDPAPSIESPLR